MKIGDNVRCKDRPLLLGKILEVRDDTPLPLARLSWYKKDSEELEEIKRWFPQRDLKVVGEKPDFGANKCPTCGEEYDKYAQYCVCSNSFHCCRDCKRENGYTVELCGYHLAEELETIKDRLVDIKSICMGIKIKS